MSGVCVTVSPVRAQGTGETADRGERSSPLLTPLLTDPWSFPGHREKMFTLLRFPQLRFGLSLLLNVKFVVEVLQLFVYFCMGVPFFF